MTDFDTFWTFYPRKRAKRDALKAWQQTEDERPALPDLLRALRQMMFSPEWCNDGGRWIPYPATWLRSYGWDDEPTRTPAQLTTEFQRDKLWSELGDVIDGADVPDNVRRMK